MKGRLAATGFAVVAALASAAGAAPTQSVTLHVHRFYSAECNCFKLQFSGRISSGATDEYVAIMQQKCGNNLSTAAAGTTTVEGGSWLAEVGLPFSPDSATYRARWEGHLSEPWTFRPEIPVWPLRRVGRRIEFALSAGEYPDQRMKGGSSSYSDSQPAGGRAYVARGSSPAASSTACSRPPLPCARAG